MSESFVRKRTQWPWSNRGPTADSLITIEVASTCKTIRVCMRKHRNQTEIETDFNSCQHSDSVIDLSKLKWPPWLLPPYVVIWLCDLCGLSEIEPMNITIRMSFPARKKLPKQREDPRGQPGHRKGNGQCLRETLNLESHHVSLQHRRFAKEEKAVFPKLEHHQSAKTKKDDTIEDLDPHPKWSPQSGDLSMMDLSSMIWSMRWRSARLSQSDLSPAVPGSGTCPACWNTSKWGGATRSRGRGIQQQCYWYTSTYPTHPNTLFLYVFLYVNTPKSFFGRKGTALASPNRSNESAALFRSWKSA